MEEIAEREPVRVARFTEAEVLELAAGAVQIRLLLDADATGGALSVVRVSLRGGTQGAGPHWHDATAETFAVLSGAVRLRAGTEVSTCTAGDVVTVPAQVVHAFSAATGQDAEVLVLTTPGLDRFDYFRRLAAGIPAAAAAAEARFDTRFPVP